MSESCHHGMPKHIGCDDCTIIDAGHRIRILEEERDSARRALNMILQAPSGVGQAVAIEVAKEREACAKECDELQQAFLDHRDKAGAEIAGELARVIRARGAQQ